MAKAQDAQQIYQEGFRNAQADRRMGLRSDYSFYSIDSQNEYVKSYARGYRAGWLAVL